MITVGYLIAGKLPLPAVTSPGVRPTCNRTVTQGYPHEMEPTSRSTHVDRVPITRAFCVGPNSSWFGVARNTLAICAYTKCVVDIVGA